jgi:hypothetical protein
MSTGTACDDVGQYITLSVSNEPSESQVQLYPNPAHDVLIITANEPNPGKYAIFSADGKCVATSVQSPVNIGEFPPGIYVVTNEARTWYKKWMKN